MGRILIADDDQSIRMVLGRALQKGGHDVRATGQGQVLMRWIAEGEGDAILLDVVMPDAGAFDLLPEIKRLRPDLPVIVLSAQNTLSTAVKAAEHGAYEYLPKPFDLKEVTEVVARALLERKSSTKEVNQPFDGVEDLIVGRSGAMQNVYRIIARLTQSDLTVLIKGESGTGKELIAHALHLYGQRSKGPFVAVNMAAIPQDLIESELFGHEKGAFTGAVARKSGRFEQADGGTLFLDEIGDMPLTAQTRLLRVLQEGEYTTVGGRSPVKTDVRIVAATHRDLTKLIADGQFREDLFYRLNVVPLHLPALRERIDDLPDLVSHFLRRMKDEGLPGKSIELAAIERLKRHAWQGNVRELENVVRRLAVVYPQDQITVASVEAELAVDLGLRGWPEKAHFDSHRTNIQDVLEDYMQEQFTGLEGQMPAGGLYHQQLLVWEAPLLRAVMQAAEGNQVKAAEILGLNRNTLRKKLKENKVQYLRGPDALDQGGG